MTLKKPSKEKRAVGSAEQMSALIAATAPGMGITLIPSIAQRRTISSPGSEIAGVPASETSAAVSPSFKRSIICSPRSLILCS